MSVLLEVGVNCADSGPRHFRARGGTHTWMEITPLSPLAKRWLLGPECGLWFIPHLAPASGFRRNALQGGVTVEPFRRQQVFAG